MGGWGGRGWGWGEISIYPYTSGSGSSMCVQTIPDTFIHRGIKAEEALAFLMSSGDKISPLSLLPRRLIITGVVGLTGEKLMASVTESIKIRDKG